MSDMTCDIGMFLDIQNKFFFLRIVSKDSAKLAFMLIMILNCSMSKKFEFENGKPSKKFKEIKGMFF